MVPLHPFPLVQHLAWTAAALSGGLYAGVTLAAKLSRARSKIETSPASEGSELVPYHSSPGACTFNVPAGWRSVGHRTHVGFVARDRGVRLSVAATVCRPTAGNILAGPLAGLGKSDKAVTIHRVRELSQSHGPLVQVQYEANARPNTSPRNIVRLAQEAHAFYKGGRVVILTLWAPRGADDTPLWKEIVGSFAWC